MSTEEQMPEGFKNVWEQYVQQSLQFYPAEYKPTKREYFANTVLSALADSTMSHEKIAKTVVAITDLTIAELNKPASATEGNEPLTVKLDTTHYFDGYKKDK